jgi:hypothetical protein
MAIESCDITQIYGSGPFGHAGATQIFVTTAIKGWLDLAEKPTIRYDPEGIIHDLFVMSPWVWNGCKRIGKLPYSTPQIMDRLERLCAVITDPQLRLFTGVFPRSKGRPSKQILWWRPFSPRSVLLGVEEDLPWLNGAIIRHESGKPPAHPHDSWCGMGTISIDWRTVACLGELCS